MADAAPSDGPPAAEIADGAPPAADADGAEDAADATELILRMAAEARGMDRSKTEIARLQEERRAIAGEKRALTKALKNETRKRQRLLKKSAQLSVPDLVQTLYIRQARAAERQQRAAERGAGKGAGK